MKHIKRAVYFALVAIYIFFEELVWNKIAVPINELIKKLKIYERFLYFIENSANKYVVLIMFLMPFAIEEIMSLMSAYLFARGQVVMAIFMYIARLPLLIVALAILRVGKLKLETIVVFKICYDFVTMLIDKLHATYIYKTTMQYLREIKESLKAERGNIFKVFAKIYHKLKNK